MERLEPRQLLAGVTMGSDGILKLTAPNNQGNTIVVYGSGSNIVAKVNATAKTVSASSVKHIRITGGNWNDTIRVNTNVHKTAVVTGGDGNDKISGGSGRDRLYGQGGHDSIYGNGGNDLLYGEVGNDLLDGGAGIDALNGGPGTNKLYNGESSSTAAYTSGATVSTVEIWDAGSNKKIQTLTSGSTIDLAKLPAKITLVAHGTAGSVKFGFNANSSYQIENLKPWSISGDNKGDLNAWNLPTGSHTVKVTPYSKSNAGGTAGATKIYTFKVIRSSGTVTPPSSGTTSSVSVSGVDVWDAVNNKKITTLTSGATLDLAKLPSKFTLIAQGSAKSVKFGLDSNNSYRIENLKPWSITGDENGKPHGWSIGTGGHTVKVTPYTGSNATGSAGATRSYTFNVIKSSTTMAPKPSEPTTETPSQPDPAPAPGTGTSTGTVAVRNSSAPAPQAVIIKVSNNSIHAGQSFHAHAMDSKLNYGTPLTARYVWNFGDSGSKYNVMEGFNAAHHYAKPGTYSVKLTVTNEAGKSHTASMTVNVQSAGRKKIYVSTSGSDANDGLSEAKPIKSWDKARSKVANNVEILFKGGQTFELKAGINVYARNFSIGSYGSGKARLKYTGVLNFSAMLWLGGGAGEQTVQNLIFDSVYTGGHGSALPHAIGVNGTGNAIIGNEFRNLGYAVNAYSRPKGLLVQDNTAPLSNGLSEYFAWAAGYDHVFQGNSVANVVGSHVLRMADMNRINVSNNNFTNPNEANGFRGTLTIHSGNYAYIRNNTLKDGWFSVGPLGNEDGLAHKSSRFNWSVFENNTINRSRFLVLHGANHTMFRNNIVKVLDHDYGIEIQGYNYEYARGVEDVKILNNTVVSNATSGNFMRLGGRAKGITLGNNLFLAPKLITGTSGAAPVFVYDKDLASFTRISNNVWPMPSMTKYAEGGINYVWPHWSNAAGYKTPAEWKAYGAVGTDYFEDLSFSSTSAAPTGGTNRDAGTIWAGVFTDRNGKVRPNSGGWTVGAIEV